MDFFRPIMSDDPLPNNSSESLKDQDPISDSDSNPNSNPGQPEEGGGWSFGGFVRTVTTKSESVLETYRRDLEEFRSGLQKETELFKEVASKAGASAIDGVLKSTAEIVAHGKETLLASYDNEFDTPDNQTNRPSFETMRYNRFEAQLRETQSYMNTYCEEPDDLDDYNKWNSGFVLEDKTDEIKDLIEENDIVDGMHKRCVPSKADNSTFWSRYFYRVFKLRQQEDVRANLVKRAVSLNDDEELTWDVDDDDEETNAVERKENQESGNSESLKSFESKEIQEVVDNSVQDSEVKENELVHKGDEKLDSDKNNAGNELNKDGDVVEPKKTSVSEEEEVGWDEIEDLGALDNKVSHNESSSSSSSSSTSALINRLSTAQEDDEDLKWDFEDDDEPLKNEK